MLWISNSTSKGCIMNNFSKGWFGCMIHQACCYMMMLDAGSSNVISCQVLWVWLATQILGSCPLRTTHSINFEFHRSGQINFKSKFKSILKWFPFSKPAYFFLRFRNRYKPKPDQCNEPSNPQLSWLNHLNPKTMWKSNWESFPHRQLQVQTNKKMKPPPLSVSTCNLNLTANIYTTTSVSSTRTTWSSFEVSNR